MTGLFTLLFLLLFFLIHCTNVADGKNTRATYDLLYNRINGLYESRDHTGKNKPNHCPSRNGSFIEKRFIVRDETTFDDQEVDYTSLRMIFFITLTVIAQLKCDLVWSEARILRKYHSMYDYKTKTEIREGIEDEYRSKLKDAGKNRDDLIFASLYISQSRGRQRLSGRIISSTSLFLVIFVETIGGLLDSSNGTISSEVLLTFRITLAFSSLVVLSAIRTRRKLFKALIFLAFFISIAIYAFLLWSSWDKCWFPSGSAYWNFAYSFLVAATTILILLFIGDTIRQVGNFDTHISNICQSIMSGDIDMLLKEKLKKRFELLKRKHRGEQEDRASILSRTWEFVRRWTVSALFFLSTFSYIADISSSNKNTVSEIIVLRICTAVFVAMTQLNDNVIEEWLIMEILKISHPVEFEKHSNEAV